MQFKLKSVLMPFRVGRGDICGQLDMLGPDSHRQVLRFPRRQQQSYTP